MYCVVEDGFDIRCNWSHGILTYITFVNHFAVLQCPLSPLILPAMFLCILINLREVIYNLSI